MYRSHLVALNITPSLISPHSAQELHFYIHQFPNTGPASLAGYRLDSWGVGLFPTSGKGFISSMASRLPVVPTQPSLHWVPGVKQPGHEDHLHLMHMLSIYGKFLQVFSVSFSSITQSEEISNDCYHQWTSHNYIFPWFCFWIWSLSVMAAFGFDYCLSQVHIWVRVKLFLCVIS
jgi:hypothetical protein